MSIIFRLLKKYVNVWSFKKCYLSERETTNPASRIFSRGGRIADFQKISEKFDDLFFLGRPNWFFELSQPKLCFATILAKFSAPQANFWKTVKEAVFGHFLKNFDKKSRVFLARAPSQKIV